MKSDTPPAPARRKNIVFALVAVVAIGAFFALRPAASPAPAPAPDGAPAKAGRPALSVRLVRAEMANWPQTLVANGNVVAWQEAIIGPEVANYRITEVRAQVGDVVRKGQVLARIDADTVGSELAEAKAAVAELTASSEEARANALRARELREKGFYSPQTQTQYQTAENTVGARLAAAKARQQAAELKMARTSIVAPDDGVISARQATVGSLTQNGQELFRLIRGGRLEWRAEVPSADLGKLQAGMPALLTGPAGERVTGKLRAVSPSVDPQTRNGLVFVDLPASTAVRAGVFARGEFELGARPAATLPQSAVVLREGFAYIFRLEGEDRVAQTKVVTGRRIGERVEIVSGLPEGARVVESGAAFLADGDAIKIVTGSAQTAGGDAK
ncbi:efflux RND transporter periplasmic adaptor subunit [Dechloromonas sp.]|uniref:efflux RND transporter periplasmic adaptor subunit n=1 Tax=Dechloromonas sp. TaxID=1917218 RepID=UPI001225180F|nr:efflux RND transporter periplasmic adaptor subunit [Dechloromonas sp.]MBU3697974.1 efflux RND transporter periplasmic adaptor subunit [Dechloromonas sp.]TEX49734.1 MAG: efflux transporter periplasmic adaptor subunit [Rhodocyclaceae bacterium]